MPYAAILLPRAVHAPFDYAIPDTMDIAEGAYVRVPMGRAEEWGVVWKLLDKTEVPLEKIKAILEVSHLPPMPEITRQFIARVADYTLSPIGNVLTMAMRVPTIFEKPRVFAPKPVIASNEVVQLSDEQAQAASILRGAVGEGYKAFVLDGVTGSGKTEVYAEAIRAALLSGKQALVLVPEIILTQPLLKRLEQRIGQPVIAWHSNLTPKQRAERWQGIVRGEAKLIVGARSALFLPYPKLGLIVVDEEHEHSFKQEEGVLYQGRDMAVLKAHLEKIPVVLASATPSLETETNCINGKYTKLILQHRHGVATLPPIEAIDMRQAKLDATHFISPQLVTAIHETIAKNEQTLLFLNRRGYAPLTLCRACGHRLKCPNCSAWVVEHRAHGRLQCHHCGYQSRLPKVCPECKAEDSLHAVGPGVERLAEELKEYFPNANVALFTSDHITTPKIAEKILKDIDDGVVNIIIGTQMVAKGHHFPNLTLVGVVDADLGLDGGDLRAAEKSFQMLLQVAGRAGRAEKKGKVMLQTYQPEHPVMQSLLKMDRAGFLKQESAYRQAASVPPFGKFASIILSGSNEAAVKNAAADLRSAAPKLPHIRVLGPAPAPLSQLKGKFRYRLLIHSDKNQSLQSFLRDWLNTVNTPSSINIKVDVDPYSFV